MKATSLKRIAAMAAISGGLSMAALGLGAGAANADSGDIPFVPGGNAGDWQSYFPLVERLGDIVTPLIGNLGATSSTGNTGGAEGLGGLGSLGNLGSLADLAGLIGG